MKIRNEFILDDGVVEEVISSGNELVGSRDFSKSVGKLVEAKLVVEYSDGSREDLLEGLDVDLVKGFDLSLDMDVFTEVFGDKE